MITVTRKEDGSAAITIHLKRPTRTQLVLGVAPSGRIDERNNGAKHELNYVFVSCYDLTFVRRSDQPELRRRLRRALTEITPQAALLDTLEETLQLTPTLSHYNMLVDMGATAAAVEAWPAVYHILLSSSNAGLPRTFIGAVRHAAELLLPEAPLRALPFLRSKALRAHHLTHVRTLARTLSAPVARRFAREARLVTATHAPRETVARLIDNDPDAFETWLGAYPMRSADYLFSYHFETDLDILRPVPPCTRFSELFIWYRKAVGAVIRSSGILLLDNDEHGALTLETEHGLLHLERISDPDELVEGADLLVVSPFYYSNITQDQDTPVYVWRASGEAMSARGTSAHGTLFFVANIFYEFRPFFVPRAPGSKLPALDDLLEQLNKHFAAVREERRLVQSIIE